ncbi:class I SAM-dependent methyltransferase [Ralstonia sp. A12]|uniref:class I SAM-dependent methyltransferase n=1 Tax=Ralstonia sp. A12 TaxID=1217052 RepID=UPI0009FEC3A9|nr:class I SAM-dependent methyltransferase [Ralstonia sp. A12]
MGKLNLMSLSPLDKRIPQWDVGSLEHRNCPFCGGKAGSLSYRRPDNLEVRRCSNCETHFVSPAPSVESLNQFYSSYHLSHFGGLDETADEVKFALEGRNPYLDVRIQVVSSLLEIDGSRVLDVGCGKGHFLFQMKRVGADVCGVDVDSDAAKFANNIGIKRVHVGSIESFEDEQGFDLISLNDVIEHPLDPRGLLERCTELLKRNGLLLIWTPNGDRIESDAEKTTLRVDLEHLQYLGASTLDVITKSLPLRIVHYESLGYPVLDGVFGEVSKNGLRKMLFRNFARRMPGFKYLNEMRIWVGKGSRERMGNYHLFCILRKSG